MEKYSLIKNPSGVKVKTPYLSIQFDSLDSYCNDVENMLTSPIVADTSGGMYQFKVKYWCDGTGNVTAYGTLDDHPVAIYNNRAKRVVPCYPNTYLCTCDKCGKNYVIEPHEAEFYTNKKPTLPRKRCPEHRKREERRCKL